jgi:outer membrane protein OmpA-like peptidoglycan-associated protein
MKAAVTGAVVLVLAPFARADADSPGPGRPLPAQAGDFAFKIEPGLAIPLSRPQSQLFEIGGGETIKALWNVTRYLDLGPSATFLALPNDNKLNAAGTAWAFGGSVRLKRPHDAADDDRFYALSPWVDVDALYVRTGDLDRAGFAAAAGLSAPIGSARAVWIGPFVRFFQTMQSDRVGFDNRDARILSLGVSLELGAGLRREAVAVAEGPPVTKEIFSCPDRDKDGIPDNVDHCPDVAGPMDNWGCPPYKKIVIRRDKIELKEKIQFAWDQAILQDVSFPLLDEVAQALKDNKGFRVQVEGHASSEGLDDHNQTLSEKRAAAVLDYLAAHGIAKDRLVSKGFSSSVPIDTNATTAGREANRRVEFVVNFIILDDGSK